MLTIITLLCFLSPGIDLSVVPHTWEIVTVIPPRSRPAPPAPPGGLSGDITTEDDPTKTAWHLRRTVSPGQTVTLPPGCQAHATVTEEKP